jgi:hypothetical protein
MPAPESLVRARELVRGCVGELGGDEGLAYAAQLAVSEVLGSLFEQNENAVEMEWHADSTQLEFVISGHDGQSLDLDRLRRRLLATAGDHIVVRYDRATVTVRVGFDL